jgi:hypothetical protein
LGEIYSQNIDYYNGFAPAYSQYFEQDVQTAFGIMKRLSMIASQNKQTDLAAKMDTLFNQKIRYFNP